MKKVYERDVLSLAGGTLLIVDKDLKPGTHVRVTVEEISPLLQYYFVQAQTNVGPCNFPLAISRDVYINDAVYAESERRGLTFNDFTIAPISFEEYDRLVSCTKGV